MAIITGQPVLASTPDKNWSSSTAPCPC